jgi:nucleotide-binding universal stress UspA family protein
MTRIVVGVDQSQAGRRAVEWALREASLTGAGVTAVRAFQASSAAFGPTVGALAVEMERDAEVHAQSVADEVVKQARATTPGTDAVVADVLVVHGTAAAAVLDAGEGADLVVVGTRGAGVLSRAVLGSVSMSVLHHARSAVVVVPETADVAGSGSGRVVVGVDHSPESLAVLRLGVRLARERSETLVPVYVYDAYARSAEFPGLSGLESSERSTLLAAAEAAGATDQPSVPVEPEVLTGHAVAGLTTVLGPTDLLVVGSRGRGGFEGLLLGSTSSQCATHAVCPVVVVRQP